MCFDINQVTSPEDFIELGEELIESGCDVQYVLQQMDDWRYFMSEAFLELQNRYPDSGW